MRRGADGAVAHDASAPAYDFRRAHRVSRERLRTLEVMYERLAVSLEGWLVSRIRGAVTLRLRGVEPCTLAEFTKRLPHPSATYVCDIAGGGGVQGAVDVGAELAFCLVDRLFGGAQEPAAAPQRALSPVERMALRVVAERVFQLLEAIWQDQVPLSLQVSGFELSPEMLQIATREDPVLVAEFDVQVGAVPSRLSICLPVAVLEPFFEGGRSRRIGAAVGPGDGDAGQRPTEQAVRATPVAIAARLPDFSISLRELAALVPGQVLATGIPRDAALVVRVGDQPRFAGSAGRIGRHLAVRLGDPLDASQS